MNWRRRRDGAWVRVDRDSDTKQTRWGVASTGQRATQGVVTMREHASGRVDAVVVPEPTTLATKPGPETRPSSSTGTFRMTRLDDGQVYVCLRDIERLIRDAGYGYLSDLLVRACGQEPARDRIVVPST